MSKSLAIGGILLLTLAGFLAVLNLRLPPEDLMFTVGDQNMPWVPPVILGVIGIVLLASAFLPKAGEPAQEESQMTIDPDKDTLNKRLEAMAWGILLIMLGCFMFVPNEIIRGGWWSICVGLLLLGLNGARYFYGLRMSGFTIFLGVASILGGIVDILGWADIDGPLFLIVLGSYLLLKPVLERRNLIGKAEYN